MPTADASPPRVFISYSHDSPEHERRVLDLSDRLRSDGIDAWIDQYTPWPVDGWPRWMECQMRGARFVLMVCTETYLRRVTGQEEPGAGRGVCWEANLVYNDLYHAKNSTSKYVPIVFSAADAQHIPPVLQGRTHFCLDIDQDYWHLYRLLTGQPEIEPGNFGLTKKLPRREPLKQQCWGQPVDVSSDIAVVPKKLDSFDEHDREFFLALLPGPYREDGLPESLFVWKRRIEQPDGDRTFRVGVMYGPSGCGKSSYVKAGLLPRLDDHVVNVHLEATRDATEVQLLSALRKRWPDLPPGLDLAETCVALRDGSLLALVSNC